MKNRIKELISKMTLEEKAGLCSGADFWNLKGIERLGIPSIMVTDGPHGLRKQQGQADNLGLYDSVPATCFPSAAGMASSWSRELLEKVGQALGRECQAEDVAILLGPGANIKRSPLCGRNFEYYSEDPYLSSEMAACFIRGVQEEGVGTSLKHYAANNQEHRRMTVNAVVDERTMREIYLASFEGAVKKSQPWTVMCSYNQVNGEFVSESKVLLTDILKNEWGHEGIVVSDWGATNERAEALLAGMELEMPASYGAGEKKIIDAVQNGTLPEDVLDQAVERILTIILKAVEGKKANAVYDREAHHALAREVARESMVLLKNDDGILPLDKSGSYAVIGAFAKEPRYQGGGSSHINPTKLELAWEEIGKKSSGNVVYAQGYHLDTDQTDPELIAEAKAAAAGADKVILFLGLPDRYESEGYDRTHLRIPENQQALIEAVHEANPHIVVVLSNGAPIEMPWIHQVKGVLEAYLGGQASGGAIADLLFGDANPSGKLAETFPKRLEDTPCYLNFPGEGDRVEYKEGIFVGYRYYDSKNVEPLFPFGFGLSYTTFKYSNLKMSKKRMKDDETVDVTVTVKNTGELTGKEIVQLYVRDVKSSVIRPEKELKGFHKTELKPGEEKTVTFTLDKRSFAYYDVDLKDWHVESGDFEICIGMSSRDIVLKERIYVESTVAKPKKVHRNTTIGDLLTDPVLAPAAKQWMEKAGEHNPLFQASADDDMFSAMMGYMPLRGLVNFSQGHFTEDMLETMIRQFNDLLETSAS